MEKIKQIIKKYQKVGFVMCLLFGHLHLVAAVTCDPATENTTCVLSGTCDSLSWQAWNTASHSQSRDGEKEEVCTFTCTTLAGDPYSNIYAGTPVNCTPTLNKRFDTQKPTCTTKITPSTWTTGDVIASVRTCADTDQAPGDDGFVASGCKNSTKVSKTLTFNDQTSSLVSIKDYAGNKRYCPESDPAKIDRKDPYLEGVGHYMGTVGYPNGDMARKLSVVSESAFAANEQFEILTDVVDGTDAISGRSGFGNEVNSWITIKEPGGTETSGPIYTLVNISLIDTGTNVKIVINDLFEVAGHYSISFQFYDMVGHFSPLVSNLLVQIVPSNVDLSKSSDLDIWGYKKNGSSFVSSASCNNLMADNSEECRYQIVFKDRFGNILGREGPLLIPPAPPSCSMFDLTPIAVVPPDNIATANNEGLLTVNWDCMDANSINYVCDGAIGSTGFGTLSPVSGMRSYEFISEVALQETIDCTFTVNGAGGSVDYNKSFNIEPFCNTNNSTFPLCFDAEFTLP